MMKTGAPFHRCKKDFYFCTFFVTVVFCASFFSLLLLGTSGSCIFSERRSLVLKKLTGFSHLKGSLLVEMLVPWIILLFLVHSVLGDFELQDDTSLDAIATCQLAEGEQTYDEITLIDLYADGTSIAVLRQCDGIVDCTKKAECQDGKSCGICGWAITTPENRRIRVRFSSATQYLYILYHNNETDITRPKGLDKGAVFALGPQLVRDDLDCMGQTNCTACIAYSSCVWCHK